MHGLIFLLLAAAVTCAAQQSAAIQPAATQAAVIRDESHRSQVMGSARAYRAFLPPAYATAKTIRYPVIYWLHGYEPENAVRDAAIAAWVATHAAIVVDSGPADTSGNFPLYFPELVEQVDRTLRTAADRAHRGITGSGAGGYLAIWQAAKVPDLVGSASSFGGPTEAATGPANFEVNCALVDVFNTIEGVRVKQAAATSPVAEILGFHLDAFAHPLSKPATFSHSDPYPNFAIWNWEVVSDRRQPAFTLLENVSSAGLRSAVREWIPGGAALPAVKLSITSPKAYSPGVIYPVTYVRLRDGKVRHARQKADSRGRLSFDVDGDAYEIGVGAVARITLASFEIVGTGWAAAGQPVQARLRFLNKGGARSAATLLKWESPTSGVKFKTPSTRLNGLAPGEGVTLAVTFTVDHAAVAGARIIAASGPASQYTIDIPVYPAAAARTDYQIADGLTLAPYTQALGEGNRDGHAAPGESFAVLLTDAGALRAAELITNDPCVDNSVRISEGSTPISVPSIRATCQPGHRIQMLARVGLNYFALEIPVWYRNP